MADPVSPLNGASASGIAEVREIGLQGMITLRGDLSHARVAGAAKGASGQDMPGPGAANMDGARGVAWMSPDEALVLCPYADVAAALKKMHAALEGSHALAVNVSDARAVFELSGPRAREVLAKLCPVDLAPDRFTSGMFRRTRMAQIPAAFWLHGPDTFRIVTFRSTAQYALDVLGAAAMPGSEVDLFA
ncbi:MAG: sarcosine oxidase subunit gamma family protein [Pseudomonadota bacterium]